MLLLRPAAAALCLWRKKPASLCPRWRYSTGWRHHCPQPSAGRHAWGRHIEHKASSTNGRLITPFQLAVAQFRGFCECIFAFDDKCDKLLPMEMTKIMIQCIWIFLWRPTLYLSCSVWRLCFFHSVVCKLGTSVVKIENDSGPNQLPCGTRHTTVRQTPMEKKKNNVCLRLKHFRCHSFFGSRWSDKSCALKLYSLFDPWHFILIQNWNHTFDNILNY